MKNVDMISVNYSAAKKQQLLTVVGLERDTGAPVFNWVHLFPNLAASHGAGEGGDSAQQIKTPFERDQARQIQLRAESVDSLSVYMDIVSSQEIATLSGWFKEISSIFPNISDLLFYCQSVNGVVRVPFSSFRCILELMFGLTGSSRRRQRQYSHHLPSSV